MAAVLTGVLTSGCADEAAAARVGDATVSDSDLMDEVKAIYGNETLWASADAEAGQPEGTAREALRGEAEGSFAQQFVAGVLQQRVTFMLIDELFDDEVGEMTDEAEAAAEQELDRQFQGAFAEFPESYRDQQIEDYAQLISVQSTLGQDGFNEAIQALIEETDVEVSSRYGTWDAETFKNSADQLAIVPPVGPAPAPSTADADPDAGH